VRLGRRAPNQPHHCHLRLSGLGTGTSRKVGLHVHVSGRIRVGDKSFTPTCPLHFCTGLELSFAMRLRHRITPSLWLRAPLGDTYFSNCGWYRKANRLM